MDFMERWINEPSFHVRNILFPVEFPPLPADGKARNMAHDILATSQKFFFISARWMLEFISKLFGMTT